MDQLSVQLNQMKSELHGFRNRKLLANQAARETATAPPTAQKAKKNKQSANLTKIPKPYIT